jgi:hypothetical protein
LGVVLNAKWDSFSEAAIHLFPEGNWLPQEGYKLTRIINGQRTEIAIKDVLSDDLDLENEKLKQRDNNDTSDEAKKNAEKNAEIAKDREELAAMVKELYRQAEITPEKLDLIRPGMTAEEFHEMAYRVAPMEPEIIPDGSVDFENMRRLQITIPNGITQKIPQNDLLLSSPTLVMDKLPNGTYESGNIQNAIWNKFGVKPSQQISGLDAFGAPGSVAYETAATILMARHYLATLSMVDEQFAQAAGFLIYDDLTDLALSYGTKVTYLVEMMGAEKSVAIEFGKENDLPAPDGLKGYGIDGLVPLRWNEPKDEADKTIISGYMIERRLNGEKEFKRLTKEPTVIGYELDETGLCFQSPIF